MRVIEPHEDIAEFTITCRSCGSRRVMVDAQTEERDDGLHVFPRLTCIVCHARWRAGNLLRTEASTGSEHGE